MKELKVYYEPIKCSPVVRQQRIDEAFDILFEELFKNMQLEKEQKKNVLKGGEKQNGRLAKSGNEPYLGL